jgi:hypothetical protein
MTLVLSHAMRSLDNRGSDSTPHLVLSYLTNFWKSHQALAPLGGRGPVLRLGVMHSRTPE